MLGWGIVGCADIAKKFVRSIKQCSHSRLVAIGSRSIEKAQQFAQECEVTQECGVQVYGSYQQVLDDPYVQAVYLPLPTTLHLEWVTLAANAGKHILIEKPVALSAEDFQKMILVCKQNNVFIMDGTMFMHHPRTAALQEILQTPEAGIMRRVNACFNFSTDAEFLQTNIRVKSDGDPLGVLGDLGWYCIRLGIVAFSRGSKSIAQPVKCTARCSKWNDQRVSPLFSCSTDFF
jgi:predicted dehydrogenase